MIILKIALLIVGIAFLIFGTLIYFRKKYNLINGFEADLKAGRKNEAYARRVGLSEIIIGIVFLVATIVLFVFSP